MTIPFVYIIRDTSNGKRYGGVKFAKGCKPSDLLTKYFTSSKIVKKLITEGREFVIDKVVEFDSKEDAIDFEELMLLTVNSHLSDDWYNQAAGKAINPDAVKRTSLERYGVENPGSTVQVREKVINTCKERFGADSRFESSDFEELRNKSMIENHGVSYSMQSPILREKSRISMLTNYGVDNPSKMQKNRDLHSKLMTEKNKVVIECEYCSAKNGYGNHTRWHGNNCKLNPARGIVSANDPHLSLNTTAAEVTTNDSVDPDSTGFIVNQVAATNINVTSSTYLYLAIA